MRAITVAAFSVAICAPSAADAAHASLDLGTISFGLGAGDYRIGGSVASERAIREWLTVDARLGVAATGFRSGVPGLFGNASVGLAWRSTTFSVDARTGIQILYFRCAYCYLVNGVAPFGGMAVTYSGASVPWSDGLRFSGEAFAYNGGVAWSMTTGPVWALGKNGR